MLLNNPIPMHSLAALLACRSGAVTRTDKEKSARD
jgi:hypothetical protein